MATIDRFQGLFKKNTGDEPDLSNATDQEIAEMAAARLSPQPLDGSESYASEDEGSPRSSSGLVSLPLLGTKPADQHQRSLAVLLAVGLIFVGALTSCSLSRPDKISEQVAASGQALMGSQRLAEGVSQALVGCPGAFSEVKDSSPVLARNVRGLQQGDNELGIDAAGAA